MTVRLLAAGDLCPGDHYFSMGHGTGSRYSNGEDPLAQIASILRASDITIANLEGPLSTLSECRRPYETEVFRGPPSAAALMRAAGIDLLHVANNHIAQHGASAFHETVSVLRQQGLQAVGLLGERGCIPVFVSIRGLAVGFLGYSFVPERYLAGQRLYAAPVLDTVLQDIDALAQSADVIVVSVHWGTEGRSRPDLDVRGAAQAMVGAGASLILGHHPHWFQPVERCGNALIAYSLGDFVFDLFWDPRSVQSALLDVELTSEGVADYRLIPIRLDRDYRVRTQSETALRRFVAEFQDPDAANHRGASSHSAVRAVELGRKMLHFVAQFHRGSTWRKVRFLADKLTSRFPVKFNVRKTIS